MKTNYSPTRLDQEAMADYIVDSVIGDATGTAQGDRCVGEPPSARYYLSALAPRDVDLTAGTVRRGRIVPTSAGFEFEVEDSSVLSLVAGCSVYYRVFPTYEEQLAVSDPNATNEERKGRTYRMRKVFARCGVKLPELSAAINAATPQQQLGAGEFTALFEEEKTAIAADCRAYRRAANAVRETDVPGEALASVADFERWIESLDGTVPVPEWGAQLSVTSRAVAGGHRRRVIAMIENLSRDPVVVRKQKTRHDDARDHFLFRVDLKVRALRGKIVPMYMDLGPDAYRYDPRLPAYATNCGVDCSVQDDVVQELRMVPAPTHTTFRMPSTEHPATSFGTLADDPIPALKQLQKDMASYAEHPDWTTSNLSDEHASRKRRDRCAFEQEIARYQEGVRWLEKDKRLLTAFRLANDTMLQLNKRRDRKYAGWRLFQLVFIVSNIPSLAWREHDPTEFKSGLWGDSEDRDPTAAATVLWFPTGQGKTEAYLGLMAVALFFDRLRGKGRGITAWCRFPLRLLSLQQTERQLMFVAAAEEVRLRNRESILEAGGDPGDPFSVGFYVGEGNTPNTLSRDENTLKSYINDERKRMSFRVVDRCPFCGERSIEIPPPDPSALRLVHRCTSCDRELPIYIVDSEIYRYLPSVIVGTLDKLAMIGLSDKFGALLGDVDCECTLHGFGRGMKCHERRAPGHERGTVVALKTPLYDPSPSLEIIDELHMVDEELGAFTGHYEGMLAVAQQELTRRQRPDGRAVRMKVICTTATIQGEDRQCEHLFGLRSVVVPLPGPTLRGSFYWTLDREKPLRRFVGVLPHRSTSEQTMARILQAYHVAIRHLERKGKGLVPALSRLSDSDFAALLDLYRVSLTYVTSLVDFGKLRRTMESQVNEHLRAVGMDELAVRELSGDTAFENVRATLDDLQRQDGDTEAVIGTSMISHGVDIDRLNVMLFNGMPKAMAEYIQASSRVGRTVLGVVFMIFNPVRERDRSHFRYHAKFHEYLDRMVQPVAINRWSRYAARKTMPGLLMAHFLQVANRDYWDAGGAPRHLHDLTRVKEAIRAVNAGGVESAQRDSVLSSLERAYNLEHDGATEISREITRDLDTALGSLKVAGAAATVGTKGRPTYRGTPDYLGLRYDPMLSLRDIANGIPFIVLAPRRK